MRCGTLGMCKTTRDMCVSFCVCVRACRGFISLNCFNDNVFWCFVLQREATQRDVERERRLRMEAEARVREATAEAERARARVHHLQRELAR